MYSYSPAYLEDGYDPAHCLNYVEYLFHPDNYRTEKCTSNGACPSKFIICPFYHTAKQSQQKKPNKNGLLSHCEKQLEDLEKLLRKKEKPQLSVTKGNSESTAVESITNNPTTFSALALMKSDSIGEIIHGFQSPAYYRYDEKVSFREDRKHEFKSFVKINLKTLVPLIFEYMCAFENCEGGTLFIGIDDDGYVKGVYMTNKDIDKLLLEIDQGCKSHFRPPLMPQKYHVAFTPVKGVRNSLELESTFVVEITIIKERGDDQLYLYNRECYMRMNASTHRLLASEIIENERVKNQKKNEKEMAEYNAILSANEKYFSKVPEKELKALKDKLQQSLEAISRIVSSPTRKQ